MSMVLQLTVFVWVETQAKWRFLALKCNTTSNLSIKDIYGAYNTVITYRKHTIAINSNNNIVLEFECIPQSTVNN